MAGKGAISIKQLHARTGEEVRRAGRSRTPVSVTDRGKVVAILAAPYLLSARLRHRTLLPEYQKLLAKRPKGDVLEDLDAVRGDR